MSCQDRLYRGMDPKAVSRRWFLEQCGVGLGAIALNTLLVEAGHAAPQPGNGSAGASPSTRVP